MKIFDPPGSDNLEDVEYYARIDAEEALLNDMGVIELKQCPCGIFHTDEEALCTFCFHHKKVQSPRKKGLEKWLG